MASFANNESEKEASAQESGADANNTTSNSNNEALEERAHAVVQVPSAGDANININSNGNGNGNELPLDWTHMGGQQPAPAIRYPADVAEILPEDTEICIVGTAGQKITHMGPDFSATVNPELTQLILRSHLIRVMEGIDKFTALELLELYDNQVDALKGLDSGEGGLPGITIRTLDMSYNVIREMKPVALCPNLQELYLANNKLKTMEGLKGLSQLRKIDLGANRIRVMDAEELSGLIHLEELWLGKNKIESIQGLEKLTKLRRLDVQSNRLTMVENLTSQCGTLEELYLAHNAITSEGASAPTGLAQDFPNLSVLDLSRNRLTTTKPFGHLKSLEELWLSGNKIAKIEDVRPISALVLDTIYLEYNPLQDDPLYRKQVAETIPALKQIDANLIGGLAAHGIPTVAVGAMTAGTNEDRLRRLQEMAVERARAETEAAEK